MLAAGRESPPVFHEKVARPDGSCRSAKTFDGMSAQHFTGEIDIEQLVQQFGSPLFVFSSKMLRQNIRSMQLAFQLRYPNTQLIWPYKTNYLAAICELIHEEGLGAEIVSEMEYQKAARHGFTTSQLVFNGPYKQPETLRQVILDGGLINIDHSKEIGDVETLARTLDLTPTVGVRLNIDAGGDPNWRRFGFRLDDGEAEDAIARIVDGGLLKVCGLHAHVGTSITDVTVYQQLVRKMVECADRIRDQHGCQIDILNIGGGFASSCLPKHCPNDTGIPSHDDYAAAICSVLNETTAHDRQPKLVIESGRALIDDAGVLITTVVAAKSMPGGRPCYVVDAGVNLLHTATTHQLSVSPCKLALKSHTATNAGQTESLVVGPLCMNTDIVSENALLPTVQRGSRLIVSPAGAYNTSLWSQFIQHRPRVVLIDESGQPHVIRNAEDNSDIDRREQRLPSRISLGQRGDASS